MSSHRGWRPCSTPLKTTTLSARTPQPSPNVSLPHSTGGRRLPLSLPTSLCQRLRMMMQCITAGVECHSVPCDESIDGVIQHIVFHLRLRERGDHSEYSAASWSNRAHQALRRCKKIQYEQFFLLALPKETNVTVNRLIAQQSTAHLPERVTSKGKRE